MKKLIVIMACLAIAASTRADLRQKYGSPVYVTYATGDGKTVNAPFLSEEFSKKYGEPVSETYQVQAGIFVTATFRENGKTKELKIEPHTPENAPNAKSVAIPYDVLRKIIDELVPPLGRGIQVRAAMDHHVRTSQDPPLPGSEEEYENVTILNYNGGGVPPFTVIQWKK